MLFRVSNLGPIRTAEIDLSKELIVLTGPNNTGKTYLTWAVYGLARIQGSRVDVPKELREWARSLLEHPEHEASFASLEQHRAALEHVLAEGLKRQLPEDFGAEPDRFRNTQFVLTGLRNQLLAAGASLGGGLALSARDGVVRVYSRKETKVIDATPELIERIASFALRWAVHNFPERAAAIFPVERLAINVFARELAANRAALVDDLVDEVVDEPEGDLLAALRSRVGRYPRAIRDALQRALRLRSESRSMFSDLADALEGEVLGGHLSKTEFDEIKFSPNTAEKLKPLGLHQSASVIKSLASLVWHLRYEARKGERLIIDEPELSLHPDNQRKVARVLAKAVNRGLKIMMSTHSDYLVRELNNLIMLSQDSDAARGLVQELGIDPESTIRPDKLGVYLVHGGECRRVDVTETGFEVKTIDEEIHRLNRDSQTIYSRLFDE